MKTYFANGQYRYIIIRLVRRSDTHLRVVRAVCLTRQTENVTVVRDHYYYARDIIIIIIIIIICLQRTNAKIFNNVALRV